MISAFTICSNNYLAQAITLAKSVKICAPNWAFHIGLVDKKCEIEGVDIPSWVTVIELIDLKIPDISSMALRYNIIELCTAVKPSYFKYLFLQYPDVQQIHYLDPDTKLFSSPRPLEIALFQANAIITPHHFTPIPLDGQFPKENLALNHGIYNLGYLGLKRGAVANEILDWWQERMIEHCRIDLQEGWFVDQLFFNYVPIYFEGVQILQHPGVNFAFWNFHERTIEDQHKLAFGNIVWPIILYHFSGFSPFDRTRPTRVDVRLGKNDSRFLADLLSEYADELLENGYIQARQLTSVYQVAYMLSKSRDKNGIRLIIRKGRQRLVRVFSYWTAQK